MVVRPNTVKAALQLPTHNEYTTLVSEDDMKQFLTLIDFKGSLAKLGPLKRLSLRKEWNFYFDSIIRAFSNKCTNFDALSIMSQQIGHSLIFDTHFDFGKALLCL